MSKVEQYCSTLLLNYVKKKMMKTKKEKVEELLKRNEDGITLTDLAKLAKISRNTAAVILAELKGSNQIKIRRIGMAKLHYWK